MTKPVEKPYLTGVNDLPEWGSDSIALAIRDTGVPYITLNPGASFRGLHDSLVNFLGNEAPQIILCLHEEHAVAIAHGYAKVTGKPLASILHSNVGLMHGSMAIFNAFCDRVPLILLGATGPVDADKRRPWIDWVHTAQDQGGLVRDYVKWDDQPASVPAAIESIFRGAQITQTAPRGPVYVCLDVALQEQKLEQPIVPSQATRFVRHGTQEPAKESLKEAIDLLQKAKRPLILAGRVSRSEKAWDERVRFAEKLNASVITDRKAGASFPTAHPLHVFTTTQNLDEESKAILLEADVILSLDWVDLSGTLKQAWPNGDVSASVISASLDIFSHNGWSKDHQGLPPVDIFLFGEPDVVVAVLSGGLSAKPALRRSPLKTDNQVVDTRGLSSLDIALALRKAVSDRFPVSFVRLPGGWPSSTWDFSHPLDFLGYDGGGGIGSGPGMAIGSALALRDLHPERVPVAVIGDGDYLMGVNAFWTAAHYRIPLLTIVANNRSYFNDEMHQDRVARSRGRNPENRWIGQQIINPEVDLAQIAAAQGLKGLGPVKDRESLIKSINEGVGIVSHGGTCVIDVHVIPRSRFGAGS